MIKKPTIQKILIKDIKFLDFNRAVNMAQVDKLLSSMRTYGQLRLPVIVKANINGKGIKNYCIDGQHLISALIKADAKDTNAIVIATNDKKEIVNMMSTLNNVVCVWSVDDYVNAYCSLSLNDYMNLRTHKLSTGFTYPTSAMILSGSEGMVHLKKGTFKSDAKDADILTKNIVDLCSFIDSTNAKMIKAYIYFFRSPSITYNHAKFMGRMAKCKANFFLAHDTILMREQFEKIYES